MIANKHHGRKAREYHERLFRKPIFPTHDEIGKMLENNEKIQKQMAEWAKNHWPTLE